VKRLPFFYGWMIVAVIFVTMAIGVNARTAFSLFFPPIIAEFGWERGVTAGAFSFGFVISGIMSPSAPAASASAIPGNRCFCRTGSFAAAGSRSGLPLPASASVPSPCCRGCS
jgi:hypothetical protein